MIKEIFELVVVTFLPFLELRASIPYGILKLQMDWVLVFFVCVLVNAILGPIIYFFIDKVLHFFFFIDFVKRLWERRVEKMQKRIKKSVEKYGEWAVAVFIAVPLPGSGSYSGAIAAYIIGLSHKKFAIANLIGVILAGLAVTAIVLFGEGAWSFFIKNM